MGCDIHAHIEIKLNGKWQHWHAPFIERDYELFELMAGVRGDVEKALAPPRGLPNYITELTKWDYEETFGHTASWLGWEDLLKVMAWLDQSLPPGHGSHVVFGYLRQNDYRPEGEVTDIRIVFWFDN